MQQQEWHGKPYYSLDAWCKNTLRRKCYKIALNAHMTCPNRDGTLDTRGCIFCSAGGSGDFAVDATGKSMKTQLSEGLVRLKDKFSPDMFSPDRLSVDNLTPDSPAPDQSACLIAYFQAYTNTYAPVSHLRQIYTEALECPWVCGISIATRPDCLPEEVIRLLSELKLVWPDKFIWIELGLQTIHEQTAAFIRRGYPLSCFEEAHDRLNEAGIPVIVHLILGLPGETPGMMLQSVQFLNGSAPFGIKLQLLHILKDTDLGAQYLAQQSDPAAAGSPFVLHPPERDEYLKLLTDCIRHLSPEIVIHRLTGDGPRKNLLAPLWSLDKRGVLNALHRQMRILDARQGDLYHI